MTWVMLLFIPLVMFILTSGSNTENTINKILTESKPTEYEWEKQRDEELARWNNRVD